MSYTLVLFHAHPDDEAIATGGTMARAKSEGHRVVLVVGDARRARRARTRRARARRAARRPARRRAARGGRDPRRRPGRVPRLPRLGHGRRADQPRARARSRAPTSKRPRPGSRASSATSTPTCSRSTTRTATTGTPITSRCTASACGRPSSPARGASTRRRRTATTSAGSWSRCPRIPTRPRPRPTSTRSASPRTSITTTVDVREFVDRKRAAMIAHASQIPTDSFFLQLPLDAFREAFGWEWFIRRDGLTHTPRDDPLRRPRRLTSAARRSFSTGRTRDTVLENAFVTQRSVPSNAIASENEFGGSARMRTTVAARGSIFGERALVGLGDPDERFRRTRRPYGPAPGGERDGCGDALRSPGRSSSRCWCRCRRPRCALPSYATPYGPDPAGRPTVALTVAVERVDPRHRVGVVVRRPRCSEPSKARPHGPAIRAAGSRSPRSPLPLSGSIRDTVSVVVVRRPRGWRRRTRARSAPSPVGSDHGRR